MSEDLLASLASVKVNVHDSAMRYVGSASRQPLKTHQQINFGGAALLSGRLPTQRLWVRSPALVTMPE